jgi:hypothetical protein
MQIYLTKNKINNKKYIGKDSKSDPSYIGSGTLLLKALRKYGFESFEKIILKDNIETPEDLNYWEKFYIEFFNAVEDKTFYNILPGGIGFAAVAVLKFDIDGNFIDRYHSLEEAAFKNDIKNKGCISLAASGIRNYCAGFRWSYTDIPNELLPTRKGRNRGVKNSYKITRTHFNTKTCEVHIYDKDMNFIETVVGFRTAADKFNLSYQMVNRSSLQNKLYKGYYFVKGNDIQITKSINLCTKD